MRPTLARWGALVVGLTGLLGQPARADTPVKAASAAKAARTAPPLRQAWWCVSGGAALVGEPVLDDQERLYFATADGYLHAFERDGRYRWSYTVAGTPRGTVTLRPQDGTIFLGTTRQLVYAIAPSGKLHWLFDTASPVWSGIHGLNAQTIVFFGLDERLYALRNSGAARYRVRAPSTPTTEPAIGPDDVVWVGLADGAARFLAAYRLEKFTLPSAVEQLVPLGNGALARAGGRAYFLSPGANPQDFGRAQFLATKSAVARSGSHPDQPDFWAVAEGATLRFPAPQKAWGLAAPIAEAPRLAGGQVWVPHSDGTLTVRSLSGEESTSLRLGERPLRSPVVGKSGKFAVVANSAGTICAARLK